MSSKNSFGNEVSVDEQAFEQHDEAAVDEDGFEVVDETQEFRATVEMEVQAKVDSNHPDARVEEGPDHIFGKTLVQEERIEAREAELDHISAQAEFGTQEGRAKRTQESAATRSAERRETFQKRAASVDPTLAPARTDPREELAQEDLAAVNQTAARLEDDLTNGPTASAVSRRLAEKVARGKSLLSATIAVTEAAQAAAGTVQPISSVDPWDYEATIQGEVTTLYQPAHPSQQQVGQIADDSGQLKLTIWRASRQNVRLREGDLVRVTAGKVSQFRGQATLAADSETRIRVLERGDGPAPMRGCDPDAEHPNGQAGQDIAWARRVIANRPG